MKSLLCLLPLLSASAFGQTNLNEVQADLAVPAMVNEAPAAGKRVPATTKGWEGTEVHHTLYLPTDWTAGGKKLPVIVEYAGNGGYSNKMGDIS